MHEVISLEILARSKVISRNVKEINKKVRSEKSLEGW